MRFPIFGTLTYDEEAAEWTGKRKFSELAGFHIPPSGKRRTTSFEVSIVAENRQQPSVEQTKAYTWLPAHEASHCRRIVRAIAHYYSWLRQQDRAWFDDHDCHEVKTGDDLRDLMEFNGMLVRSDHFRGSALLGFSFACKWDDEHGLGVLTHRSRIIDVGQAEAAYREPDEASSRWLDICTARERAAAVEVIEAISKPSRQRRRSSGAARQEKDKKTDSSADLLNAEEQLRRIDRLSSAIHDGDLAGAQKLLQQGVDVNLMGAVLFSVVGTCNVEAAQLMIDAGAPLDFESHGTTLLQKARYMIEFIRDRPELHRLRPAARERRLKRAVEVLRILEAAGAR